MIYHQQASVFEPAAKLFGKPKYILTDDWLAAHHHPVFINLEWYPYELENMVMMSDHI